MDDQDTNTQDMDFRLRRLIIGDAQQPRPRNTRSSSPSNHNMPATSNETLPPRMRKTGQRVQRSRTGWFDELAYGRRPQNGSPSESSFSSTRNDPLSEAARNSTQTWYHSLVHEDEASFTSENRQVHQTGNSERYRFRSRDHDSSNTGAALHTEGFADDEMYPERDNDVDVRVRQWAQQETAERDIDLPDDTHHLPVNTGPVAVQQMDSEPRGASSDTIEVLVHHLDSLQQSCLQAVREGVDKITNSITHLQDYIGPSQSRGYPSRGSRKIKLTYHPVRRSNEARQRQKNIRDHLARLLAQAHPAPVIEEADANAFQLRWNLERDISCCTTENFRIDLNGAPKSAWNRSASQIFARSYCDFFDIPVQTRQEVLVDVAEGFLQRIKTLKYQRKAQSLDVSEQMRLAKMSRQRTRKTTLFHRRLEAAERHPCLLRHVEILQRLGVDGMSSDESDYDELPSNPPAAMRSPRYYVLRPKWRHEYLSDWLETFDVVYNIMRRESLGRRGAYARRRVQNSTVATRSQNNSFVPHLPANAYDQVWLSGRRDVPFSIVPTEEYNFAHDSEVFRYMQGTVLELPRNP